MVPIIVYLVISLVKNPRIWLRGFEKKFSSLIELHPDPYRMDSSRRKTPEETEEIIMKEVPFTG